MTLDGVALDNGQHLLIGAYRRTLGLIERVHPAGRAPALFHRLPLTLRPFGGPAAGGVALKARHLPSPFHLAGGILTARGLSLPERLALVDDFRRLARAEFRTPPGQTVAQCFAGTPLRALRRGVGAAVHLGAQHAARDRVGAGVRERAANGVHGASR